MMWHKRSVETGTDSSGLSRFLPKAQGCLVRYITEDDRLRLVTRLKIISYILVVVSYVLFYLVYAEFGELHKIESIFKVSGVIYFFGMGKDFCKFEL